MHLQVSLRPIGRSVLQSLVAALLLSLLAGSASAASILATAWSQPGVGIDSPGPVYLFDATGSIADIGLLNTIPSELTNDPIQVKFAPGATGDLLVSAGTPGAAGLNYIYRFAVDTAGHFTKKTPITSGVKATVTGLAFSPSGFSFPAGELYTADYNSQTVSRYKYNTKTKNYALVGSFQAAFDQNAQELVFAPWGELFVADSGSLGQVTRWKYVKVGTKYQWTQKNPPFRIEVNGQGQLHGMVFRGNELFVANPIFNTIHRMVFDPAKLDAAPQPGTGISVSYGPVDICMDSVGRMYVSSHFYGTIARILFDAAGTATVEKYFQVDTYLGGIDFRP